MKNGTNKIIRAYNLLKKRLPKKYIVPIKIYANTVEVLKAEARDCGISYAEVFDHYMFYLITLPQEEQYMNTKYLPNAHDDLPSPYEIAALGGKESILLSKEMCLSRRFNDIVFLLLHEFAHAYGIMNEKKADQFAIRWMKTLIKEGLIKWKEKK